MKRGILIVTVSLLAVLASTVRACAQEILINSYDNVYEVAGTVGNCQLNPLGNFGITESMLSLALHKDTLYIVTTTGDLYQVNMKTYFTSYLDNLSIGPSTDLIAFTCDSAGMLIGVDYYASKLIRYNPYTKTKIVTDCPLSPDGDMIYYRDTLLFACNGPYIYAVDTANPAASKVWMSTGSYVFFGLFTAPGDCQKNRLFGISGDNQIVEIDPDTRTILGIRCTLRLNGLDAASSWEDGTFGGLKIDSIGLSPSCVNKGTVSVFSASAIAGTLSFTLDGTLKNSTGYFTNVPAGTHTIELTTASGCKVDSSFNLAGLPAPVYSLATVDPQDCSHRDGLISVTPGDPNANWLYSLNGGQKQTGSSFGNLAGGVNRLSIFYGDGCKTDTNVLLSYQQSTPYPASLAVNPTTCSAGNGSILITPTTTELFTASLDNRNSQGLSFQKLNSGDHLLHVTLTGGCGFDSVIHIAEVQNPEPLVSAVTQDQECGVNNGNIDLSVSGSFGPYQWSLDNKPFSSQSSFGNLAPSTYTVAVRDRDGCTWDSSFTIKAYISTPVSVAVDSVNPVCNDQNGGKLTITVQGDQSPYQFGIKNSLYSSGATVGGLDYGVYSIVVLNKDGCPVDSMLVPLGLILLPECKKVYVPSAFSPNGDGINDLFRVVYYPDITDVHLQVFNRYGGNIFSSSVKSPGWDGYYHGVAQPAGTYIWKVTYVDHDRNRQTARGTVTLVR